MCVGKYRVNHINGEEYSEKNLKLLCYVIKDVRRYAIAMLQ